MANETEMTREERRAKLDEMAEYMRQFGFTDPLFDSGDSTVRCVSNGNGISVRLNAVRNTLKLTTISGMVTCSIDELSYPNKNLPIFLKQIERHNFE